MDMGSVSMSAAFCPARGFTGFLFDLVVCFLAMVD